MVMGVIHLVAPNAQLLPLKAFQSNGTGNLSDILRAIYYAAQNNANVINMSFDFKTPSQELSNALDYANQLNIICIASAGNDGAMETVYPAALQTDVMGVASTSDLDTRSTFSNFGNAIVWVAAPGEAIITTYPFSTYSAGWGTSFSAPFVSGGAALLRALQDWHQPIPRVCRNRSRAIRWRRHGQRPPGFADGPHRFAIGLRFPGLHRRRRALRHNHYRGTNRKLLRFRSAHRRFQSNDNVDVRGSADGFDLCRLPCLLSHGRLKRGNRQRFLMTTMRSSATPAGNPRFVSPSASLASFRP